MTFFVVFGVLMMFSSSLWNADCSSEFRRTRRYFSNGGNTITDTNNNGNTHSTVNGQPVTVQGIPTGIRPYGVGSSMISSMPVYPISNGNIQPPPSSAGTHRTVMNSNGQREFIINGRRVSENELERSGLIYPHITGTDNSNRNYPSSLRPIHRDVVVNKGTERTIHRPISNQNIPTTTESINEKHDKMNTLSFRDAPNRLPGARVEVSKGASNTGEYERTVSLLIQGRLDVNRTVNGGTFLHAVAAAGNEKLARLLIHNGADFTARNSQGKSASNIARDKGLTELAQVLQENVAQKACDIYTNVPKVLQIDRIIGGQTVNSRAEFPWMAALGYLDFSNRVNYNCAGTLISEKFVLTAAHCVRDNDRPVRVRLGQMYLNNTEGTITNVYHEIEEIIRHPDYSNLRKINDIALIRLVTPVYFSEFIRPACLQTYLRDENPNLELTVTGWGTVSPLRRSQPNALLKANINTVPWSKCNSTIFNRAQSRSFETAFQQGIDECHYCAAHPNGDSDTCQGDSGGPLQIVHANTNMSTIVGVISTGFSCGSSIPGIYTRVAYFIDWIESHVWPNGEITKPILNENT